jgi:hypothetical protein
MKAVITFTDNENGSVDIEGQVEPPVEGQLPTGAQILFAYCNTHIEEIVDAAQIWFRDGMVKKLVKDKEVVIDD